MRTIQPGIESFSTGVLRLVGQPEVEPAAGQLGEQVPEALQVEDVVDLSTWVAP